MSNPYTTRQEDDLLRTATGQFGQGGANYQNQNSFNVDSELDHLHNVQYEPKKTARFLRSNSDMNQSLNKSVKIEALSEKSNSKISKYIRQPSNRSSFSKKQRDL